VDVSTPPLLGWGPALAQTLAALVLVCLLAVIGIRLWARLHPGAGRAIADLARLGSLSLGQGATVHLVRVRGRDFLLGVTPGSVRLLADLDPAGPGPVDAAASPDGAVAPGSVPTPRPATAEEPPR